MASKIRVFEVGPRDGLQNEKRPVNLDLKLELVRGLIKAGVRDLELGAFVRPDRVPQMADTEKVYDAIHSKKLKLSGARAWSLVPNLRGLERALSSGARHIAVFTAASETFAQKNIGMSIRDSLAEFKHVIAAARGAGVEVRGYVSMVFGCPYEGKVSPKKALQVAEKLIDLGVCQVSLGDTIGIAHPKAVDSVVKPALKSFGIKKVAVHFHDTRGTALANALRSLELGVTTIDSSAGGLGGCPYAPGATGNLATEDLVYMLNGMGCDTGIDLDLLAQSSLKFAKRIGRPLTSRYLQAYSAQT